MAKTLLMRLEGPVQSWNATAGNKYRMTAPRPTKTAVVGLLANACGRNFDDPVDDLAALNYAVRADRPGHVERDYHTAGGGSYPALPRDRHFGLDPDKTGLTFRPQTVNRPSKNVDPDKPAPIFGATAGSGAANPKQIEEYLLVDACFTVALTGDDTTINQLAEALKHPARALFLGKKAHPMSAPPFLAVTDDADPVEALNSNPPEDQERNPAPWQVWFTTTNDDPDGTVVNDQPIHFGERPKRTARVEATTIVGGSPNQPSLSSFF